MSAIFGILRFDGDAVAASDLERMGATLRHRGPDGRKVAREGPVGIGHCLMRVNQEDLFEAQPIRDRAAKLTLVADCRIDNREELAAEFGISDVALADLPDSALILRAYAKWGEPCAEHLLGDFAFALWDGAADKLVLGRDHMGQRTIFYHRGEGFFAFASEIKALWALADVPRELRDEELARFFHKTVYLRPEGGTLYAGIGVTPGGTIMTVGRDGTISQRGYWTPRADPAHEGRDEPYYIEQYRAVLAEAVACRLRRLTAPAALLMSAGFDTAAIAGLAGPVVTAQRRKLLSLSWLGLEDVEPSRGDIRPWLDACRRVMPHLDVRELTRKAEDPLTGLEAVFKNADGPGAGDRRTSDYLFAQARAAGARLVMDGYGGDYTLNPRGFGALARLLRSGRLRRFVAEFRAHVRETGRSPWRTLKHEVVLMLLPPAFVRWQRRLRQMGAHARSASALGEVEGPRLAELRERDALAGPPPADAIASTAMRASIQRVATRISRGAAPGGAVPAAAHGLDLTRPFHDKRVVELALAVPEDLYVRNGMNRYLARRALADVYPPEFQSRGRKNEGILGDLTVLETARPALLAEAERLGANPKLSRYFDFERARLILADPGQSDRSSPHQAAALRALLAARFVEWFSGANDR
jgi:asparagine synthase (glutamine-hydrolysing)